MVFTCINRTSHSPTTMSQLAPRTSKLGANSSILEQCVQRYLNGPEQKLTAQKKYNEK